MYDGNLVRNNAVVQLMNDVGETINDWSTPCWYDVTYLHWKSFGSYDSFFT